MTKKLGILVVHGIGDQGPDYAEEMIAEISARLSKIDRVDPEYIQWDAVHWAPILSVKANRLWRKLKTNSKMDWLPLRRLLVNFGGDVAGYRRVSAEEVKKGTYFQIHDKVRESIQSLRNSLGNDNYPLLVIGHSLGAQILSNYIWDIQKGDSVVQVSNNQFEKMETLCGMVTFGCNMPIFTLAYDNVRAISFPLENLKIHINENEIKKVVIWKNFYDRDDVLGFPMKNLYTTGPNIPIEDWEINVGGILSSWNPMSHTEYWTDDDFTKPVTNMIANIYKAIK